MVKTFEEIIDKQSFDAKTGLGQVVSIKDCLELLKLVRLQTLIESANKADVDYNIINSNIKDEYFREKQIEVYVLKESILGLDKNSIEL